MCSWRLVLGKEIRRERDRLTVVEWLVGNPISLDHLAAMQHTIRAVVFVEIGGRFHESFVCTEHGNEQLRVVARQELGLAESLELSCFLDLWLDRPPADRFIWSLLVLENIVEL